MAILTISAQFGSRGEELARELAGRSGFRLVTREVIEEMMCAEFGAEPPASLDQPAVLSANKPPACPAAERPWAWLPEPGPEPNIPKVLHPAPGGSNGHPGGSNGHGTHSATTPEANLGPAATATGTRNAQAAEINLYADMVAGIVADLAASEDMVLLGCGGQMLLADAAAAVHLRVVAPRAWRAASVAAELGLAPPAAAALVARYDARDVYYMRSVFARSGLRSDLYHLVLNTAALDFDQALDAALAIVENTGLRHAGMLSAEGVERVKVRSKIRLARRFADLPGSPLLERVSFAHPSERVFARLMDFYGIEWEYEPRTFPIEWNERQEVTEAFAPDFYLPELDLYVELTTMKQSLVTRKNRKVKRLRQIYPDVNIRVFYQKDVEDLIFKLGVRQPVRSR